MMKTEAFSLVLCQLNIQVVKTLILMIATLVGTPKLLKFQDSENSCYEYRIATDMAMTVRKIMILLYGAGGVPGRGEIPMIQISSLFLSDFP